MTKRSRLINSRWKVYESIRADLWSLSKDSQIAYANEIASTYRAFAGMLNQQGQKAEAQRVLDLLKEP